MSLTVAPWHICDSLGGSGKNFVYSQDLNPVFWRSPSFSNRTVNVKKWREWVQVIGVNVRFHKAQHPYINNKKWYHHWASAMSTLSIWWKNASWCRSWNWGWNAIIFTVAVSWYLMGVFWRGAPTNIGIVLFSRFKTIFDPKTAIFMGQSNPILQMMQMTKHQKKWHQIILFYVTKRDTDGEVDVWWLYLSNSSIHNLELKFGDNLPILLHWYDGIKVTWISFSDLIFMK